MAYQWNTPGGNTERNNENLPERPTSAFPSYSNTNTLPLHPYEECGSNSNYSPSYPFDYTPNNSYPHPPNQANTLPRVQTRWNYNPGYSFPSTTPTIPDNSYNNYNPPTQHYYSPDPVSNNPTNDCHNYVNPVSNYQSIDSPYPNNSLYIPTPAKHHTSNSNSNIVATSWTNDTENLNTSNNYGPTTSITSTVNVPKTLENPHVSICQPSTSATSYDNYKSSALSQKPTGQTLTYHNRSIETPSSFPVLDTVTMREPFSPTSEVKNKLQPLPSLRTNETGDLPRLPGTSEDHEFSSSGELTPIQLNGLLEELDSPSAREDSPDNFSPNGSERQKVPHKREKLTPRFCPNPEIMEVGAREYMTAFNQAEEIIFRTKRSLVPHEGLQEGIRNLLKRPPYTVMGWLQAFEDPRWRFIKEVACKTGNYWETPQGHLCLDCASQVETNTPFCRKIRIHELRRSAWLQGTICGNCYQLIPKFKSAAKCSHCIVAYWSRRGALRRGALINIKESSIILPNKRNHPESGPN